MHRASLRLHSYCQSRLRWCFYSIHSQRDSSVPVANTDKQAIESLTLQDSSGKALARKEEDTKNVFVDDLSATLEAHRASNRASVIRRTKQRKPSLGASISRPLLANSSCEGSTITETKALARKEEDTKNVFVDDLSATLEAHRASNKARVIRRTKQRKPSLGASISRPLLANSSCEGSTITETHEVKESRSRQMWRAGSVQAQGRCGTTGSRVSIRKTNHIDYTGVTQWPKQPWEITHSSDPLSLQRPWLAYMETTNENFLQRLTNEIKAYEAYMRLSLPEEAAAELVISDVNAVAEIELGINPLTLLGSRKTGLATPISDFDFTFRLPISYLGGRILPPSEAVVDRDMKRKAVKVLRKINKHFRYSNKFANTNLFRYARVPIIQSTHVGTGLNVQIQTMAPYQAAQEYTVAYLSEFPSLRPLYIVLRYCLEVRDLTTVFKGGLGSYSILMMIVTAMKHSSGNFASDDLASQLLHVLDFYGKADLYKVGFSANPPCVFAKQEKGWSLEEKTTRMVSSQPSGIEKIHKFHPRQSFLLCLQDPANDANDLGKKAHAIKHVQATFNEARESILVALQEQNEKSDNRAKGATWAYLDHLVRADYKPFEVRRNRIERYAQPRKLDERDYLNKRIRKVFEERVLNRYEGAATEDDNIPEPALEAIKGLTEGKTKSQRPCGTNDDEYGWVPSSSGDRKTLLEAIAAPKLALAAKISASKHHLKHRREAGQDSQTTGTPTPNVSSTKQQQPNFNAPLQTTAPNKKRPLHQQLQRSVSPKSISTRCISNGSARPEPERYPSTRWD